MDQQIRFPSIAVFGLGYVGCVTAACLARLGHRVTGVDPDAHKVEKISRGEAPFFEPGLDDAVREAVGDGLLTATASPAACVRDCEIVLICVGTPPQRNGDTDLQQLRRAVAEIREHLPARGDAPLIVAVRSTVYPGTCEEIVEAAFRPFRNVDVVANPEFQRTGSAMRDFLEPALIVAGGANPSAVDRVAALYQTLGGEICRVSLRTAEMIKYACNAFHAMKICFANEMSTLSETAGIDGAAVMDILCKDTRLNASAAYLRPGFAFGGSCLSKDLRTLAHRASRADADLPLLRAILPSNEAQLKRATQAILDTGARRVGMMGLAFKKNTDDVRESAAVRMIEILIGKGVELRIYDPVVSLDGIYGSNRRYLLEALPHVGRLLAPTPEAVTTWAECLVVTQAPSAALLRSIEDSGVPLVDVAGALPSHFSSTAGSAVDER